MSSSASNLIPDGVVTSYGNLITPVNPVSGVTVIVPSKLTVTIPLGTLIGVPITTGVPLIAVTLEPAGIISLSNGE
jgi:hypothetical protein